MSAAAPESAVLIGMQFKGNGKCVSNDNCCKYFPSFFTTEPAVLVDSAKSSQFTQTSRTLHTDRQTDIDADIQTD